MNSTSEDERPAMKCFVFLDLETTGIFRSSPFDPLNDPLIPGDLDRQSSKMLAKHIKCTTAAEAPHITEISLVAATRNSLQSAINKINSGMESKTVCATLINERLPCNIFTCQVQPNLSESEWKTFEEDRRKINALVYTREDLKDKNDFATEWKSVRLFLEQVPKPACVVAHGGLRFDYRVIYFELERHNLLSTQPIPEQVYFIDSHVMFLDLEKKLHDELRTAVQLIDWCRLPREMSNEDCTCSQGTSAVVNREAWVIAADGSFEKCDDELLEATQPPTSPTIQKRPARRRLFADASEDHPLQYIRTSKWSPAKKKRVRPNFFQRTSGGDWVFNHHASFKYFREKGAFKLETMYQQLLNRPFDAHYAEEDCEALLQVCIAYGGEFIDYADKHAVKFPY